ncbi:MAG: tetratricopeptide repeat protein [Muribaculaceae bacterium]|nr:tetratricopeptide repeat protein [Muribaculaceae bacterium]
MKTIQEIKEMLSRSEGQEALNAAGEIINSKDVNRETLANAYYLRGNAYRQEGNIRLALNNYLEAMEIDPDGPAAEAYRHLQELLAYYHKDYYNP